LAQVAEIVVALHDNTVAARIEGVGPTVLNIPSLITELLETDEIVHRLPCDAGERHLTGEMKQNDIATRFHS
jgi:hypothetical protein